MEETKIPISVAEQKRQNVVANLTDAVTGMQNKIDTLREGTDYQTLTYAIYFAVFVIIADMVIFGYLWKHHGLLITFFILGFGILAVLLIAKRIWYPKEFFKEFPVEKKSNKSNDMFGDLGLSSSESYDKQIKKII